MEEVDVISLDFAGTLITMDMIDYFWNEAIPRYYAKERGISLEEAREFILSEYDKIGMKDLRWYLPRYWLDRFKLKVSIEELLRESLRYLKVFEDVRKALPKITSKFTTIIVSNASREFIEAFLEHEKIKIDKVFSTVTDLGVISKTPEVYKKIGKEMGNRKILHVGDDFVQDFINPRIAGWRSLLLNREASDRKGKDVISSLEELVAQII